MNAAMQSPLTQGRNEKAMGPHSIRVTRIYDAKPAKVFKAWTDPASLRAWFAKGEHVSADVRVSGLFYIEVYNLEKINPHYGRYLRIDGPHTLEFTWVSEWTMGKESVVLVELAERNGKTELTLTHDGLPNEILADAHRQGWNSCLEELESSV